MFIRLFNLFKDMLGVIKHHDNQERQEMLTNFGVWYKEDVSHVHVGRKRGAVCREEGPRIES